MTTTQRMNNFKRLAQHFSRGEKLLTTQDKISLMRQNLPGRQHLDDLIELDQPRFSRIRLVSNPCRQ